MEKRTREKRQGEKGKTKVNKDKKQKRSQATGEWAVSHSYSNWKMAEVQFPLSAGLRSCWLLTNC